MQGALRPLNKERWAGAVDVAGGALLANLLSMMKCRCVVAACGLAAGMDLPSSVSPFILRGFRLIGVDSVMCPKSERERAWDKLSRELDLALLETMTTEIPMDHVIETAPNFLGGTVRGRIVVPVAG